MGRLQRKKLTHLKKKTKDVSIIGSSGSVKNAKSLLFVETPGISKKMRVISSKRSLSKSGFSNNKIAIKLNKGLQFFREVSLELKKVTWPTRKQTIGLTVVVIILVLIISLFLGIIDIGLSSLIRLVLH